jgi:hypothetical protein
MVEGKIFPYGVRYRMTKIVVIKTVLCDIQSRACNVVVFPTLEHECFGFLPASAGEFRISILNILFRNYRQGQFTLTLCGGGILQKLNKGCYCRYYENP